MISTKGVSFMGARLPAAIILMVSVFLLAGGAALLQAQPAPAEPPSLESPTPEGGATPADTPTGGEERIAFPSLLPSDPNEAIRRIEENLLTDQVDHAFIYLTAIQDFYQNSQLYADGKDKDAYLSFLASNETRFALLLADAYYQLLDNGGLVGNVNRLQLATAAFDEAINTNSGTIKYYLGRVDALFQLNETRDEGGLNDDNLARLADALMAEADASPGFCNYQNVKDENLQYHFIVYKMSVTAGESAGGSCPCDVYQYEWRRISSIVSRTAILALQTRSPEQSMILAPSFIRLATWGRTFHPAIGLIFPFPGADGQPAGFRFDEIIDNAGFDGGNLKAAIELALAGYYHDARLADRCLAFGRLGLRDVRSPILRAKAALKMSMVFYDPVWGDFFKPGEELKFRRDLKSSAFFAASQCITSLDGQETEASGIKDLRAACVDQLGLMGAALLADYSDAEIPSADLASVLRNPALLTLSDQDLSSDFHLELARYYRLRKDNDQAALHYQLGIRRMAQDIAFVMRQKFQTIPAGTPATDIDATLVECCQGEIRDFKRQIELAKIVVKDFSPHSMLRQQIENYSQFAMKLDAPFTNGGLGL